MLRRGARGDAVRKLQQQLGIKVDGVFGPQTERAVRDFQRKNGLKVDGIVGPKTQAALGGGGGKKKKPPSGQVKKGRPPNPKPGPSHKEKVEGYGFLKKFLDQHPELRRLVEKAVKEEWTPDRFETALRASKWYQNRNEDQRKWDILVGNDPKQAKQVRGETEVRVRQIAEQMGVTLTDEQVRQFAQNVYRGGIDDTMLRARIADRGALGGANEEGELTGTAGVTQDELQRLAQDYGVPVGDARMNEMIRDVLAGRQTVEQFQSYYQEMAKGMFPDLADQLDAGYSTKQLLDPYIQLTAGTLEMDSDLIDLTDPRWLPQKAEGGMMTLNEWQQHIRQDKSYGFQNTKGGQDEAWKMADRIGRLFGSA